MERDQGHAFLKHRRAVIQGSCTRIKSFVESIETVMPAIAAQLEERRVKLNQFWSDYENVQTQLKSINEEETSHRANFEEAFYELSARIREWLVPIALPQNWGTQTPSNEVNVTRSLTHVRLPKLDLPSFSGRYDEWFPFFDTFHSIIHSNESISDIQKLHYLKGCLKDEAGQIINSLEITALNYEVAWNLLKERYDNKHVIVQNHIKSIMELPCMSKENSNELRQIADGATRHIQALQALKRPTSYWDDLLVHILSGKLDSRTAREWQSSLTTTDLPTLKQFLEFITHQCHTLEATKAGIAIAKSGTRHPASAGRQTSGVATVKIKCGYCRGEHSIYYCKDFLALSIPKRIAEIRKNKICVNCLRSTAHASNKCSSGNCKICKLKHNTLLHAVKEVQGPLDKEPLEGEIADPTKASNVLATPSIDTRHNEQIMLSTAIVYAYDRTGSRVPCRVLLDCGSQANFISKQFLDILGIESKLLDVSISGINNIVTKATRVAQVRLQSRIDAFDATINCIISEQVTDKVPAHTLKRKSFEIPQNIKLADPQFNVASDIDLLLGAELFWSILCIGQIRASSTHPTLQKTRFGWIVAGRFDAFLGEPQHVRTFHASVSNVQLHDQLVRFWRLENINAPNNYTNEELRCENEFLQNVTRNPQGRYVVKLPFKQSMLSKLGGSRDVALKRLRGLEKRFDRDPVLRAQYVSFLREYLSLQHMKQIEDDEGRSFYLPHQCVFKKMSQPSSIRVVFDASSKISTGISLNDSLMTGPVVQQDLITILLRFRTFRYVFTADIIKMYRQILVDPTHTRYQRILWRDNPHEEIRTYELATITYGISPASYLATRCLKHLAESHCDDYSLGSVCVQRDFYMDDLLTGANNLEEAIRARDETISLLRRGRFELSKWASNCPELLKDLRDRNSNIITIDSHATDTCILGMHWNQANDMFYFSYLHNVVNDVASKRAILSEISRLFDPLGLLGPTIVLAKLILQDIWQSGIHWDESVLPDIAVRWTKFKSQLSYLSQIKIPRCVGIGRRPLMHIHGFYDASQRAFGACAYLRIQTGNNSFQSELICSKSCVAPLKAISLPKLELSAALLLAQLIDKITKSFESLDLRDILWSDSTIALNWISSPSRKWAVFVANRVGEIQRLTVPKSWRHIPSNNNPADLLSRGVDLRELATSSLWWHGPAFLEEPEDSWPNGKFNILEDNIPESAKSMASVAKVQNAVVEELLSRHSSLSKACRVLAYCLRFRYFKRSSPLTTFVSHTEIAAALDVMCRNIQKLYFADELKALTKGDTIKVSSNLLSLSPFINKDGLIRVGGRLKNAELPFDVCHPILLPKNHNLTRLIIEQEHARNAHAGAQATMAAVRQRFWPLSLRSVVRKIIQKCVTCFKNRPIFSETIMGSLPSGRVNTSRAFHHCGVDYAGPFLIREGRRRNARLNKAYVLVFVCLATKAVHIELVSDLTSNTFIAALKRFVARRGKPACMYSDNGTTFVRARRQLKELYELLNNCQVQDNIKQFLREQGTSWNFIPPNAPHFGGLWEAAVKSTKHYLHRIVGRAHLNFEEIQTMLCEIEAILNSRPITQLSSDPNDLMYLTPGHFLIGTPLNGLPSSDLCDVNENRLVRWQRVDQLRQHFWRRWSMEYIHSLQERHKWKSNKGRQLKVGQLVLLKQPGLAPLHWIIGRIEEVHADSDSNARSAAIKTTSGSLIRPLSKIAILPLEP